MFYFLFLNFELLKRSNLVVVPSFKVSEELVSFMYLKDNYQNKKEVYQKKIVALFSPEENNFHLL